MIEIGLCTDQRYARYCGICITSIFESNTTHAVRIHILTDGLDKLTRQRLSATADRYKQEVVIHTIDTHLIDALRTTDRFSRAAYFRLLFPDVLDRQINKLLYLDCDLLVVDDLMPLWQTDLQGKAIGMAWDQDADNIIHQNRLDTALTYANSGVLLLNLRRWREEKIAQACVRYIDTYPERCLYVDQDAVNGLLYADRVWFDPRYNLQELYYFTPQNWQLHRDKHAQIYRALSQPAIIHYTGMYKPWDRKCYHPLKEHWHAIEAISLFAEKKDPLRGIKRAIRKLCKKSA